MKTYHKIQIDIIFTFRHVLQQNFEKRQDEKNLCWNDVKNLKDSYLSERLQDFAQRMDIHIIGPHELNYLSNKILDDLEK